MDKLTKLNIRPEQEADHQAITQVIDHAFEGKPYADGDESDLLLSLRAENALSLSLVAEVGNQVVGQIAFSPAKAADGSTGWYALGPLAVLPEFQNQGIGSRLVREGLIAIKNDKANGCILVGEPIFYNRFGFVVSPTHAP